MAIRMLVVDDDVVLAESLRKGFEQNGYTMVHTVNSEQSREMLKNHIFDVVILDIMLGAENGVELCRDIRGSGNSIPIIMLSSLDHVEQKVDALETGADDYICKPFAFPELMARVRGLVRRGVNSPAASSTIECEGIVLDLNHRTATRDGANMSLTPKEFSLLELFMRNPGKLINRVALAEKVWDRNFALNTNIIDVYITYLRKKLNEGGRPNLVHTVRGSGYIFERRD